jgi:CDP-diacylglycerol--serine O-phosphatidyltransferase
MTEPLSPQVRDMETRIHRRRRFRRHGRKAYIRSVYFLPSMATLGNAICGFAAIYVAGLAGDAIGPDPLAIRLGNHRFIAAAYFVLAAMVMDALDGRLARFTRHTTEFGGQLDSLADVISFGAAPAFLALQIFKVDGPMVHFTVSRLIWAIGALYMSCAAIRLANFNVSNKHGEQHHFSFLGLPSPGAAAAVVAYILLQQHLAHIGWDKISFTLVCLLPFLVLAAGLLMVSNIRYPHLVNRYLRGKRSYRRLLLVLSMALLFLVAHDFALAFCALTYAFWGPLSWAISRGRPKLLAPPPAVPPH